MIDIDKYIAQLIKQLKCQFESRLLYVGLQGSYLRGEATEDSDIDIMVVIDKLNVTDLERYRAIIQSMAYADKSCGFICSRTDLINWNPMEMHHVLHTTKDYYGVLSKLSPAYTTSDIQNFVKLSLNNLYHEICHRYIHGDINKNIAMLPRTYKGVFYILQNLYYLRWNKYITTKAELLPLLDGKDREVLERSMQFDNGIHYDFPQCFELLFTWCQESLMSIC